MKLIMCECCGSNQLQSHGGNSLICNFCGSIYRIDENERILSKEMTDARIMALFVEAEKHRQAKEYGEEIQVLAKALELDENNANVLVKLGRAYRVLNFPGKALEYYERAQSIDPDFPQVYSNTGAVYLVQKDYERAAECYEKALSLISAADVDYPTVLANYAIVLARTGEKRKAAKFMNKAEKLGYQNGAAARKMAGLGTFSRLFGV